jgi:hypothetical protein
MIFRNDVDPRPICGDTPSRGHFDLRLIASISSTLSAGASNEAGALGFAQASLAAYPGTTGKKSAA